VFAAASRQTTLRRRKLAGFSEDLDDQQGALAADVKVFGASADNVPPD